MKLYQESKLANGLSIITAEDKNADIVTASLCIKAGSRYEQLDERGYAHILEHMLVKATQKMPSPQRLGDVIDRAGAYSNATTSPESLRLHMQVVCSRFEDLFEIMSDMAVVPLLDSQMLETEKKVILEELHRFYDNDDARMSAESDASVFGAHPLGLNPIGDEESISHATIERLRTYYGKYVVPKRSTLIAVGNISHAEIVSLAEKHLMRWNNGVIHEEIQSIPEQNSGHVFTKLSRTQTTFFFNFLHPQAGIREALLLHFVANILTYGKAPFLKQELRHKGGLVYAVSAHATPYQDVTLMRVVAGTTEPKKVLALLPELLSLCDTLYVKNIFSELKEQFKNVFVRLLNDPYYEVGMLWIYKKLAGNMVTPEDMFHVIDSFSYDEFVAIKNKYLSKDNMFVAAFGKEDPFEN